MKDKKKIFLIVAIVLAVIILLTGSTFAYLQWATANEQSTGVTFTTTKGFSCSADGGGNITNLEKQLLPTNCSLSNDYVIKRKITTNVINNRNVPIYMDLWLDIKSIASELAGTSNFRYALTDSDSNCNSGNIISSGSFSDTNNTTNNKIYILNNDMNQSSGNKTYYLYIWLDAAETNLATMDKPFHFELGGECRDSAPEKASLVDFNRWNNTSYFKESAYKTKITDINFTYEKLVSYDVKNNYVKTYNLGSNASKPITGYLVDGEEENTYKLYIASDYIILPSSNFSSVFEGMTSLKSINFNNIDTSNVNDMSQMFSGCTSLKLLDLRSFNTSKVTNMSGMFFSCTNLTSLDVSSFNTEKVKTMARMFMNDTKIVTLDLSNFRTPSLEDMSEMFRASKFTTVDFSGANTSNVTNMWYMFSVAAINNLDIRNFDFSSVTNSNGMFWVGGGSTWNIIVKDQTAKDWIQSRFGNGTVNISIAG